MIQRSRLLIVALLCSWSCSHPGTPAPSAPSAAATVVPAPAAPRSETPPALEYDLVLQGGRVIDPESGLDGVRNVGIQAGKIAAVSASPLKGRATIDASGLVVAPGFIDMHAHGQDPYSS